MVHVDISAMSEGLHDVLLQPGPDAVGLDETEWKDLNVAVHLDIGTKQILAEIDVSGTVGLVCDRTLVEFEQEVQGRHMVVFTKDPTDVSEKDPNDVRIVGPHERALDITDVVRDTLLLAIPLRKVAPEASEVQLVLQYGLPENGEDTVDPRWAALAKLKAKS